MIYLRPAQFSETFECPYGKGAKACYRDFIAVDLSKNELDNLLVEGWRKFGPYFFVPKCNACTDCIPIRLAPASFVLAHSQSRIVKKNWDLRIVQGPLNFRPEIFNLYVEFQRARFAKADCDIEQFYQSFYLVSNHGLQIEYFSQDILIGVGFVDVTDMAMSSVYFFWKQEEHKRSLGIFSILHEIEIAKAMKLKFYYLGYALEGLPSMSYKFQFKPHQLYNWKLGEWENK
ncbi:MAG: arginyltransferase [Bdellovibrio sp.]|nr:arginyltransferase [Bdellovibrio sp.]